MRGGNWWQCSKGKRTESDDGCMGRAWSTNKFRASPEGLEAVAQWYPGSAQAGAEVTFTTLRLQRRTISAGLKRAKNGTLPHA